jgi:hypothetical protein
MTTNQIKVIPATIIKSALTPLASRDYYECANSAITRGVTSAPQTLPECYDRFPEIENIADALDVGATFWIGPTSSTTGIGPTIVRDLLTGITAGECTRIKSDLGSDWLGCLWGSPNSSFSCTCPYIGSKFDSYLKLRLNVATFWKTPKDVPVNRRKFLDNLKYLSKVEITVAGNFSLKAGDLIEIKVDQATRTPFSGNSSIFSGRYMVLALKHVVNNGGTHEMTITATQLPPSS